MYGWFYVKSKRFSHRCAAIAVWRALRRRRLHDDVGHIKGVISALLKGRKWTSSAVFKCLYLYMCICPEFFVCLFSCISSSLCVSLYCAHSLWPCVSVLWRWIPCRSQAGPKIGSGWAAAWHHAGSYGTGHQHCWTPSCSGYQRRRHAACSSRGLKVRAKCLSQWWKGGTEKQGKGKSLIYCVQTEK